MGSQEAWVLVTLLPIDGIILGTPLTSPSHNLCGHKMECSREEVISIQDYPVRTFLV